MNRNRRTDADKFVVFSLKLARYLESKGYEIKQTRPDLRNTGRDVFLFDDTPQLQSAISTYMR